MVFKVNFLVKPTWIAGRNISRKKKPQNKQFQNYGENNNQEV